MASSIKHFAHPKHRLQRTGDMSIFLCDLCQKAGVGRHYRCDVCNFDLHEACAAYPELFTSYAHPWHELSLIPGPETWCDVCGDKMNGYFYRCLPCGFDLHTHCSLLPQNARSELHPAHSLMLLPGPARCSACEEVSLLWSYRCGPCGVRLHIKCLHGAPEKERGGKQGGSTSSGSGSRRRGGRDDDDDGDVDDLLKRLAQRAAVANLAKHFSEMLNQK